MTAEVKKEGAVIPTWAKAVGSYTIAVIVSVVSTISFLSGHFATKAELQLVAKDVQTIQKVEEKLDEVDQKLNNLRVLIAKIK